MSYKKKFNIWEYTYYTITKFYIKSESKYGLEDNKRTGAYALGLLVAFNIISLVAIILAISIEKTAMLENLLFPIFATILLVSVFFIIYNFEKKNHEQIFNKYKKESLKKKKIRIFLVFLYIALSVILMLLAVYVGRIKVYVGRINWMQ